MKINKILVHHSDRNMLPVDDDPTHMPRIRNPDLLHSDHTLPPEPGMSQHGRSSLRSPRPCWLIYVIMITDKYSTTYKESSSYTSLTASEGLKINRKFATPRRSPAGGGAGTKSPAQLGRP